LAPGARGGAGSAPGGTARPGGGADPAAGRPWGCRPGRAGPAGAGSGPGPAAAAAGGAGAGRADRRPRPGRRGVAQAQVAEAEANLALAEEELKWAEIRSPLTGTVLSVQVEAGETIQEGAVVATVGRLDRMRVTVPVHEIDVNRVRRGLPARVEADAAPGRIFEGTVTSVATVGTTQSGIVTFDVTVELENEANLLRPGM